MKILFLVPYPLNEAPSQRFRFEQYFNIIKENGGAYHVEAFLTSQAWKRLYEPSFFVHRVFDVLIGFIKRILSLGNLRKYNYVFIHRETTPIGPPLIEWIIAKVLKKKIIYDFDDAIWLPDRTDEHLIIKILKWRKKIKLLCKWADKVSCGNLYLCSFAKQYNKTVIYNPTTLDLENLHYSNRYLKDLKKSVSIGWTGSHSTLPYLSSIEGVLKILEEKYPYLDIIVIANKRPKLNLKNLKFYKWALETEIEDLMQIDIGIMPLPDDEWAKGKCGFKAMQYLAMEIPAVVSPIGVNPEIIEHGVQGFLAKTTQDWITLLSKLIESESLRKDLGNKGRKKIEKYYSVNSNASNFLSLFEFSDKNNKPIT